MTHLFNLVKVTLYSILSVPFAIFDLIGFWLLPFLRYFVFKYPSKLLKISIKRITKIDLVTKIIFFYTVYKYLANMIFLLAHIFFDDCIDASTGKLNDYAITLIEVINSTAKYVSLGSFYYCMTIDHNLSLLINLFS